MFHRFLVVYRPLLINNENSSGYRLIAFRWHNCCSLFSKSPKKLSIMNIYCFMMPRAIVKVRSIKVEQHLNKRNAFRKLIKIDVMNYQLFRWCQQNKLETLCLLRTHDKFKLLSSWVREPHKQTLSVDLLPNRCIDVRGRNHKKNLKNI